MDTRVCFSMIVNRRDVCIKWDQVKSVYSTHSISNVVPVIISGQVCCTCNNRWPGVARIWLCATSMMQILNVFFACMLMTRLRQRHFEGSQWSDDSDVEWWQRGHLLFCQNSFGLECCDPFFEVYCKYCDRTEKKHRFQLFSFVSTAFDSYCIDSYCIGR